MGDDPADEGPALGRARASRQTAEGGDTMKRRLLSRAGLAVISAAALALAVAGLAGTAVGKTNAPKATPIVVGAALSETGFFSEFDQTNTIALKLAVQD